MMTLVFKLKGCRNRGAQKAPLITISRLRPPVTLVIVVTLALPTNGPAGALTQIVVAPLRTVDATLTGLLIQAKEQKFPPLTLRKQWKSLLQRLSDVIKRSPVGKTSKVSRTVSTLESAVNFRMLPLRIVKFLRRTLSAGPVACAQLQLADRFRLGRLQVADKQTGVSMVLARGLPSPFNRVRQSRTSTSLTADLFPRETIHISTPLLPHYPKPTPA